jgi:hypothetical protein
MVYGGREERNYWSNRIKGDYMRFALIENNREEAQPKMQGLCPCCLQSVIAKCGEQKIWHWAHRKNTVCDNWWEPETEWHRAWKDNFPTEWQEIPLSDEQTGKKHIADVRTGNNLVIEFQHSSIDPQDRLAREIFYQEMVWVVDGTRLQGDYSRFFKGKKEKKICRNDEGKIDIFETFYPEKLFPSSWLYSLVPVVFDFKGNVPTGNTEDVCDDLYCLFPLRKMFRCAIFAKISRKSFIKTTKNGEWSLRVNRFMNSLDLSIQEKIDWQNQVMKQKSKKRVQLERDSEFDQLPLCKVELDEQSQPQTQAQNQQISFYQRRSRFRRGPLIDYIEKKQFPGQYKPRGGTKGKGGRQ